MRERGLVIGYESALEFWRRARAAASRDLSCEVGRVFGRGHETTGELAARALAVTGLEGPLDVVVGGGGGRHHCDLLRDHMSAAPLPDDQLLSVDRDIAVCRMPVVLVQLARGADVVDLAEVAYEVAGTYVLTPWADDGFARAARPLVDLEDLLGYARAARAVGVRGAKRACDALELVVPGSNSPMETDVAVLMSLTRARGGLSLGGFVMNPKVAIPEPFDRVVGGPVIRPDFYWPEHGIVLEYESDRFHASAEAMKRDERRRRAFEAAGFLHRRLLSDVLSSDGQLNIFVRELVSHVDPYRAPASEAMLRRRRALRARLFGPPAAGDAMLELNSPLHGPFV